jgi:enoyl-CoA hydratase/carnithine racemase
MACTARICVAGQKQLLAQPEPLLGIIPGAGGTQRLPRIVGIEKAAALLRTGRPVSSAESVEMGLCLEEVKGEIRDRAIALARDIARGTKKVKPVERGPLTGVPAALPPVDIGHLSKRIDAILCRVILDGARLPLAAGLDLEASAFADVCRTRDMRIGVENFVKNGPRAKAAFVHE